MSRQILCLKCADGAIGLHPSDARMGWKHRVVYISLPATPPPTHGVTMNGVFQPMPHYHCDLCNEQVSGTIGVAVTRIPPDKEIGDWESDVGKIMSSDEVETYRRLAK